MTRNVTIIVLMLALSTTATADTFKHRKTGEIFHGFRTQKQKDNRTLVYNAEDKSFKPLVLGEYQVTRDDQGRRNSVIVIPIRNEESLISQGVSDTIARTIIDASNKGPKCIILEIDCPGGYGEYMKKLCLTITNTTNCPVIAYIAGGKYGGAFSAATAVAVSCEKIYIAGDAVMGSLAPAVGSPGVRANTDDYTAMFSSSNLSGFRTYVSAIASNRSRPTAIAMAFVDKSMEIIEVEDRDGNRRLIKKGDEKPLDEIIRTVSKVETRTIADDNSEGGTTDVAHTVLTLTADEVVKAGLADAVVAGREGILEAIGAADAQVTYSRGVATAIRKFVAAKRNIQKSLVQIDFLQERVDILQGQFNRLDEQIRTSPTTREQRYGDGYGGSFRSRRNDYNRSRTIGGRNDYRRRNDYGRGSQYVTGVEVPAGAYELVQELGVTVTNLSREYRRALGLARRDPGALPPDVTMTGLQNRLDKSLALQNSLYARFN